MAHKLSLGPEPAIGGNKWHNYHVENVSVAIWFMLIPVHDAGDKVPTFWERKWSSSSIELLPVGQVTWLWGVHEMWNADECVSLS